MADRWEELKQLTAAAMGDPRLGDRFHDMYTFWVYIVDLGSESVTTYEVSGHPSTFPDVGGRLRVFPNRAEFRKSYQYGSIPGYWVTLCDRDKDVSGWVQRLMANEAVACVHPEADR